MSVALAAAVEDVRLTIADLRASWAWLQELAQPGPETRAAPVLSDSERSRQASTVAAERAERASRGRWTEVGHGQFRHTGASALARTSAPIRVAVVDAQAAVHQLVLRAARRIAGGLGADYVGGRPGRAVGDALDWLDPGPGAWIVDTGGDIWRRPAQGPLGQILDSVALADANRYLRRADRLARHRAGDTGEPVIPFGHPCPACAARSLQWHMPRPEHRFRRDWSVVCISEACHCKGMGCGCRQRIRYEGRRHAWAYGELDGPYGLWMAIDRAARVPITIGSKAVGHGGWPERKTAPS